MSQSLHPMLNIAIKAARAAGAIINRGSQDLDLIKITAKGPNDFVSEVDQAAEAAIIEILLTAYPGHAILAEESGREHGAQNSEFCWIIDPLDGTTNFLHGLPMYAVSIALAFRGVVQQAVVYDPTRNDLFYASRGRGAFLNDKRLRVSKRTRLADCLIGTGFPFRKGDNLPRYLKMFETVMSACAGLRRPGAAALDLCYVAAGWYDGFFETGLSPWDLAAGSLIITEAGGLVGNFTGEADFLHQREIVAGNPKIYGQLVGLLAPYSRVIKDDEAADGLGAMVNAAITGGTAPAQRDTPMAMLAASPAVSGRATAKSADTETTDATTRTADAAPADRERKPVRIRKPDAPAGFAPGNPGPGYGPGPRRDNDRPRGPRPEGAERPWGPRQDAGDRQRGGPHQDGERERPAGPMPGRPLPVKR
jgi:myo-inositol-1(or 4)-monophosphatase